jgi:hypothetical protein
MSCSCGNSRSQLSSWNIQQSTFATDRYYGYWRCSSVPRAHIQQQSALPLFTTTINAVFQCGARGNLETVNIKFILQSHTRLKNYT